jgi:hypothetical protein
MCAMNAMNAINEERAICAVYAIHGECDGNAARAMNGNTP